MFLLTAVLFASCGRRAKMETLHMEPTIKKGGIFIIKSVNINKLNRYDIIVADSPFPKQTKGLWVERILGLPSEELKITKGGVFINNKKITPPSVLKHIYLENAKFLNISLGKDEYFVVGDNTANSRDSRFCGPIKRKSIVGKVDK